MISTHTSNSNRPVGVVGAGSFGITVANILAKKVQVILYARDVNQVADMNTSRMARGVRLHPNIVATNEIKEVGMMCDVIFPVISSQGFRSAIKSLSPYLRPYHILIHCTKGLDLDENLIGPEVKLTRQHVKTMSEVVTEESSVVRVGCMAGPNLSKEIAEGLPAATVIASQFDEVINIGQQLLKNEKFLVYGSHDLIGIELCGVLKNIIAISAGIVAGLGLGENAKSLLVSRGMVEMIHLGKALGGNVNAFLGLAGIGDLIATCNSPLSRNFTVGYELAQGKKLSDILSEMGEVAEGIHTIEIIRRLAASYHVRVPITETLYDVINGKKTVEEANTFLMKFPFRVEIDFL